MSAPRIGCAVVTHNSAEAVEGLLASLGALDPHAVAVVDHESTDRTLEILGDWRPGCNVDVLRRPNRGYAAGANAAVAALSARGVEIVALLNPDARILGADLQGLRDLFGAEPRLGSACPVTLSSDGARLDTLGLRLTPWGAVADHGQGEPATWTGTRPIPGVIGPCGGSAIYRTEALAELRGPFDERFFLYFEDADVSLRLQAAGWSTITTDLVTVEHGRSGLGGLHGDLTTPGARRAARERQRSYELFVSDAAPLPFQTRIIGPAAARIRRHMVTRDLRRAETADQPG
jgi:N-acetylglucosaminyl-diphospho-decaprenol L-rhamnosyltransferase